MYYHAGITGRAAYIMKLFQHILGFKNLFKFLQNFTQLIFALSSLTVAYALLVFTGNLTAFTQVDINFTVNPKSGKIRQVSCIIQGWQEKPAPM